MYGFLLQKFEHHPSLPAQLKESGFGHPIKFMVIVLFFLQFYNGRKFFRAATTKLCCYVSGINITH
jgi:hypothetical protein